LGHAQFGEVTERARPPLPNFDDPPVSEVALSFQFERLALRAAHFGLLWTRFRDRFPKTEDRPLIPPAVEEFPPRVSGPGFSFELLEQPPHLRVWFLDEDESELVQIQHDRVAHNWRRRSNQAYPRYPSLRASFVGDVGEVQAFAAEHGLGELIVNQVEATYINEIVGPDGNVDLNSTPSRYFSLWAGAYSEGEAPDLEDLRFNVSFPRTTGKAMGRVHVDLKPARPLDSGRMLLLLTLTARGRPAGPSTADAFDLLDACREWIVRTFAAITTPEAHRLWRRKE
jgi:uncharacterized protein (TIGR04255 family)